LNWEEMAAAYQRSVPMRYRRPADQLDGEIHAPVDEAPEDVSPGVHLQNKQYLDYVRGVAQVEQLPAEESPAADEAKGRFLLVEFDPSPQLVRYSSDCVGAASDYARYVLCEIDRMDGGEMSFVDAGRRIKSHGAQWNGHHLPRVFIEFADEDDAAIAANGFD